MALHSNDMILAGPVSRAETRMFGDFGFLTVTLAGLKVKFDLKSGDKRSAEVQDEAPQARSAILTSGYFASRQDKKDAGKWYYEIGGRRWGVKFLDYEVPILNQATVSGDVKHAAGPWLLVGSQYMIPRKPPQKNEWRDRLVWVLCSQPAETYMGRTILAVGAARPRVESEWRLHLAASGIWVLR